MNPKRNTQPKSPSNRFDGGDTIERSRRQQSIGQSEALVSSQSHRATNSRRTRASAPYEPTFRDLVVPIVRDVLAEVCIGPLMITQKNCEAAFGISSRTHLENCRRADFTPRVLAVGKLRLVDAAEYLAWLREISRRDHHDENIDPEDGAAVLLRELGLQEVNASTKKSSRARATRDLTPTKVD